MATTAIDATTSAAATRLPSVRAALRGRPQLTLVINRRATGVTRELGAGWDEERRELADFIARRRVRNLVMIAGDAHMVAVDDGTNSDFSSSRQAGFPVLHAAALDRGPEVKGGPYSGGAIGGSGQFGTLAVHDDGGSRVTVTLTGWNYRSERLLEYTFTRTLEPERLR